MKHVFVIAALVLATACTTHHIESDSKSNWLRHCAERAQCPQDAACVCGVCTKSCANADACRGLSDAQTVCLDPSAQGLLGCQSDPATGPNVCLLACQTNAECDGTLSCVRGVCISATLADAGTPVATGLDASTSPPVGHLDASTPPVVGQTGLDAGSTTQVGPFDAGHTKPTMDPDDDGGLPACTCSVGLVCGIPVTCATEGVKVLTTELSGNAEIYAADADYVYGVIHSGEEGKLMRWPTRGGDGQAMAQGMNFYFGTTRFSNNQSSTSSTQPPLIVDDQHLYFLAAADASELSYSLWSMPKDDSQVPAQHGYAGTVLTQDADYLYFSNDGDSRVLRTGKATLDTSDQREEVYRSTQDAPLTILLLAVNSTSVFVTEVPPNTQEVSTYTVTRVAKVDSSKAVLGTNERFGSSPRSTFANDAYFVLGGSGGAARLDLATNEVKPLTTQGYEWTSMSFADGAVYGASGGSGSGSFWVVDLPTARRTLLASQNVVVTSNVAVSGAVYAMMSQFANASQHLVRIELKP